MAETRKLYLWLGCGENDGIIGGITPFYTGTFAATNRQLAERFGEYVKEVCDASGHSAKLVVVDLANAETLEVVNGVN
jgi:hypothetical protein